MSPQHRCTLNRLSVTVSLLHSIIALHPTLFLYRYYVPLCHMYDTNVDCFGLLVTQ